MSARLHDNSRKNGLTALKLLTQHHHINISVEFEDELNSFRIFWFSIGFSMNECRHIRIISESYVYLKKCILWLWLSDSRMSEHQNYHEDFLWARLVLAVRIQKGFRSNTARIWTMCFHLLQRKSFFHRLIFIVYCSPIRFTHKQKTNSMFPNSENCKVIYLWSEDRSLVGDQRDCWLHWKHFLHDYVLHIGNLAFFPLYSM
jgi:hypothetical protein